MVIYELATQPEWIPYLASVFAPAIPVWIMGRAAAERPACDKRESLFWGWRDVVLPFISGLRVPHDTLFLVCEADWCFSPEHEQVLREYMADTDGKYVWCPPIPPKQTPQSDQPADAALPTGRAKGKGKGKGKGKDAAGTQRPTKRRAYDPRADTPAGRPEDQPPRMWQWWFPERRRRANSRPGEYQVGSQTLHDLVYFCNTASFHGVGDLVWLSYDGYRWGKRPGVPGNGTTALGLTKQGALNLAHYLTLSEQPGHLDRRLGEALFTAEHDQWECVLMLKESASYAWASFGGYVAHVSGCDPKVGFRPCKWVDPIQPYTRAFPERPARDARWDRWLVRCCNTGAAKDNKVASVNPRSEDRPGFWLTYFPEEVFVDGQPDADKCAEIIAGQIQQRRPSSGLAEAETGDAVPQDLQTS